MLSLMKYISIIILYVCLGHLLFSFLENIRKQTDVKEFTTGDYFQIVLLWPIFAFTALLAFIWNWLEPIFKRR